MVQVKKYEENGTDSQQIEIKLHGHTWLDTVPLFSVAYGYSLLRDDSTGFFSPCKL